MLSMSRLEVSASMSNVTSQQDRLTSCDREEEQCKRETSTTRLTKSISLFSLRLYSVDSQIMYNLRYPTPKVKNCTTPPKDLRLPLELNLIMSMPSLSWSRSFGY